MKNFIDNLKVYIVMIGLIGLVMGIINSIKGKYDFARTGFIFFGVAVIVVILSLVFSKISEKIAIKDNPQPPHLETHNNIEPLTVLGMVVLLERPLRFENDKNALIQSIFSQQVSEFKRLISPNAQVEVRVAGSGMDDEAYVYGVCRSAFDGVDSYADNNEFMQRVATGSFTASDGNRGKHFAFLNRKI